MTQQPHTKSAYVHLIGLPNAGKSTLLNAILKTEISVTNRKVQTTRTLIRGIHTEDQTQLIFVDTPGLFDAQKTYEKTLVGTAKSSLADADIILYIIDARITSDVHTDHIIGLLKEAKKPCYLVLNKIDLIDKSKLLPLAKKLRELYSFKQTCMISSLEGKGVDPLIKSLIERAPDGPWYYPEDQLTDMSERDYAADVTREKIFNFLHEEIPYSTKVITQEWQQQEDGSARIEQMIITDRDSHKGMIIGKGGQTLKKLGMASRTELEKVMGHPCHLFIRVKVDKDWKAKEGKSKK